VFTSLKKLIDSRLGRLIVIDDLMISNGYFVKVAPAHLQAAAFFLKNDPDTRLILLDQIVAIKAGILPWPTAGITAHDSWEILYQLRSLKLPYRVTLAVSPPKDSLVPSIGALFLGARWLEADISLNQGVEFEDNARDMP
jgi:NADH:ubiquinone oxidoreductase subunit C